MFWTEQERRLTSPHSFLDANPLARSDSVSVANPLDGSRNCLTRAIEVISGSLPVLRSVPFSLGPQYRPVSRLSQARTPQKRNRTGKTGHGQRTPRATRPRPKATATSRQPEPHNAAQKINFGGPIRKLFPHSKRPRLGFWNQGAHVLDSVPFSSTRTLDQACNPRPDTPPPVTVRAGTSCPRSGRGKPLLDFLSGRHLLCRDRKCL